MESLKASSAKSLQRRYQRTFLAIGIVLLAALLIYSWVAFRVERDAFRASVKAQSEQLKLSLDDKIDVVRAHVFAMQSAVERGLARPEVAQASQLTRPRTRLGGAADALPLQDLLKAVQPDIGSLQVVPRASIDPPSFQQNVAAVASFLPIAATDHQWSKVFQWSYFYDSGERWFMIYPPLQTDELMRASKTRDMTEAMQAFFDADGTKPVTLTGPRSNPKREMVWTPPYQDTSGKGMMVTLLAPVYLADAYVGAIATDITLNTLDQVLLAHAPEAGRAMVIDADGVLLADTGKALKGATDKVKFTSLFPGESTEGKTWLKFPLEKTQWTLLVHADDASMNALAANALLPYVGLAVLLILALLGLGYLQNRRYAGPALQLAEFVEQVDARPDTALPVVPAAWQSVFTRVASAALERRQLLSNAQAQAEELEHKVKARTHELSMTNDQLSANVASLEKAHNDLLRSDRLGSLGAHVASVANELEAPLGEAASTTRQLESMRQSLEASLKTGLRKADLEDFVAQVAKSADVLSSSIDQASSLVRRFKQLAVDQTSEQARNFKLRDVAENVLAVLRPSIRRSDCRIANQVDATIDLTTYAGTLGQVISRVLGAAAERVCQRPAGGDVCLSAAWSTGERGEVITITVTDDGFAEDEPDLEITERLVRERLGGTLVQDTSAEGTRISITVPRDVA